MVSSLAEQLAKTASLNAVLLSESSRRKATESYLFTGKEADRHDLESLHALGSNSFFQLISLNPAFRTFEGSLFSNAAKSTDRTLQSSDINAQLNKQLGSFLRLLGPYLMDAPAGKVIEWLVRRFRVNEFNVEDVLTLFLPYHESPHFAKMLTILHIKENSSWSFLSPFKSAAQAVPRVSLVTEMLRNSDFARFIASLLPNAVTSGYSHRTLIAFSAASLHDFITRSIVLDEGTVAYLLPSLLGPLQVSSTTHPSPKDAILGSYILLSTLSQKCALKPIALKTIVNAMTSCASRVSTKQFVNAAVSVCESQDEVEGFSEATLKSVIELPNVIEELKEAFVWVGIEKFISPLLSIAATRINENSTFSFVQSIIISPKIPSVVIQQLSALLLKLAISLNESGFGVSPARRLLSVIQQRHPQILQTVTDRMISQENEVQEVIGKLIISLSMAHTPSIISVSESTNFGYEDMIVASTNVDAKSRTVAVKSLLNILASEQIIHPETIHSALLGRVLDTDVQVLEALYHNPGMIIPILSKDTSFYIKYLERVLCDATSKPKRPFLRTHLTFLVLHFCPHPSVGPSFLGEIFHRIIFPFLLFSKPRQHTAELVWQIVDRSLGGQGLCIGGYEWIKGCSESLKLGEEGEGIDVVEKMSRTNIAVASKIADNILMSNNYMPHLEALIAKLNDPNAHARALGYYVARALLIRLSGEHQIDAAHRILEVVDLEQLSGMDDFSGSSDNFDFPQARIDQAVVLKPSSTNTLHWLQASIVALIPNIPCPAGCTLDWIGNTSSDPTDTRGFRYVKLMGTVYKLANLLTQSSGFSSFLLRGLFVNLKDDALAFLAGIWICSTSVQDQQFGVLALRHGVAFLEAYIPEADAVDFQTVLPSLIIALQTPDIGGREAAIKCISLLAQLAQKRFSMVYGFDTIYGASSEELQYLDQNDFQRYAESLTAHQDHFLKDLEYTKAFHHEHLRKIKSDTKKDSEYKLRVLCFLLSHVRALRLPAAQISLLKIVEGISDKSKAQILLPTIQRLIQDPDTVAKHDFQREELSTLVLSCFDSSVSSELNTSSSSLWPVFISAMKYYFQSHSPSSPRMALTQGLQQGLFANLNVERKIEICGLLLTIGTRDANAYAYCKALLANILLDVSVIAHLVISLQPSTSEDGSRATKRARISEISEDVIPLLTLLAEVLGANPLPGSLDLISRLLETLNQVVQYVSPTQTDTSYVEQLLMSAIEGAANKIQEAPNLTPSALRLDVLIELIRVANNPQTFHQALLLMASLARLAPDSILHNVMPIFTFMGSNVFHRDDAYSFRVVQKTIDSIVPVMVSSLKRTHASRLELYIGSREFLRIFTDAANHIPRHRRTHFFSHLIDVLGYDDFLPPVCMLLIEKMANRITRQNADEVVGSLSLPLTILEHYPTPVRHFVLLELLREGQRLCARVIDPENTQSFFLEAAHDEEHSLSLSAVLKRRAQALIIFVGYALKPSSSKVSLDDIPDVDAVGQFVSLLINIATVTGEAPADHKLIEISQAARSSLNQVVAIMSAADFLRATSMMLEAGEDKVQVGALDLLSDRLPNVSDEVRKISTANLTTIITSIRMVITIHPQGPLTVSALKALKTIALGTSPGEETSLTETIPLVLSALHNHTGAEFGMAALAPLVIKLGPRIIPFFRDIIKRCVSILQTSTELNPVAEETLSVLHALITTIPTFWGSGELSLVLQLYIDQCVLPANQKSLAMSSLMRAISKRLPPKILLPTLYQLWSSSELSKQIGTFIGYFDALKRSLRNASRPAVLEHLRPLFKVFMEAFDGISSFSSLNKDEAKDHAIPAFLELVIKLNDAAFRPLFRRLYDWAFVNEADSSTTRRITFCHVYIALLDFFKGLMNPYMSFLLQPFVDTLKTFMNTPVDDKDLWSCIIEVLTKSFVSDDGAFWRDDKLRQIASPLVAQVVVSVRLNEGKTSLPNCLSALTDCVVDDTLLKAINLDLLMHTRSEDARLRLFALTCSEALWREQGGKLIGFVAETTTFIAECAEDENDSVVSEAHKLKSAVEAVAGSISGI